MKHSTISLLIAASLLVSCNKPELPDLNSGSNTGANPAYVYAPPNTPPANPPGTPTGGYGQPAVPNPNAKAILVDASKDFGGWWYPQGPSTGFNAETNHQGKPLADYLRNLGHRVDELPRGATITTELLSQYSIVIRATAFFINDTTEELSAYEAFLNRSSSLLLINDHLLNPATVNDRLSAYLGLIFEGAQWGPITSFQPHPIITGVNSLSYIAGSVIRNWDPSKITVLGSINVQSGDGEGTMLGAMGIVNHPTSKIFFIGDINGIEQVPQPFTSNIVKWLFQ